jgi:hypothetical protein
VTLLAANDSWLAKKNANVLVFVHKGIITVPASFVKLRLETNADSQNCFRQKKELYETVE